VRASLNVRPEEEADYAAAAAVMLDAFGPGDGPVVAALARDIRASENYVPGFALVAEEESGVVGHVMLSWAGLEGAARDRILNLTPLSVRGDRQRRAIGSRLVEQALRLAEDAQEPAVLVEGIPAYYPRFGFERARPLGFAPPSERIPDEAFMVRRLSRYDPALAGRVVYPAAFDPLGY
jgi:putative acetyltransferase